VGLVARDATRFETDMPMYRAAEWPPAVRAAANQLARHSSGRGGQSDGYKSTGLVSALDSEDWSSFVAFSAYAYDASVWSADGELVQLSDEGDSLVVHLTAEDRQALERFEPAAVIVPRSDWKRLRAVWNERRREERAPRGN
jgi:hypothetical protein